jgi:hypothetical protein
LLTTALTRPIRNGVPRNRLPPYERSSMTPAAMAARPAAAPMMMPSWPPRLRPAGTGGVDGSSSYCEGKRSRIEGASSPVRDGTMASASIIA